MSDTIRLQRNAIKNKHKKGFTLIEIVVTVAILSFGIVSIYEALFVSMDTYGYYTHYLSTQDWISEKIWESQAELIEGDMLEEEQTAGQFIRDHKTYSWVQSIHLMDVDQDLYKLKITLSWQDGDKKSSVAREAYLLPSRLKQYTEEGAV